MIRRLRNLQAGHEGERRPFNLGDTVGETATLLRAEAWRRDVTLDHCLKAQHSDLLGDPVQTKQVIINM